MGTEKKRLGIKTELIAIAAIPSIIIALVVIILAGSSLSEGLDNKELAGLTHLAEAVNAGYNVIEGNYRVDDDGTLWKGDTNLTQEIDLIDSFVGDSDAEVTLFIDKTRRLTTLVDNSSGERIVGTDADDEVWNIVKGGNTYTNLELKINGKNYACVYVPLKDSSGDIVGMAFAGEPSADIEGYIRSRIVKFAVFTVILLVVAIVVGALISKKIGKNIAQTEEAIFSLSEGNLNVVMAEEVLKRPDEIGDMGRAINALVEKLRDIIGKINDTVEDLKKDGESLDSLATNSSNAADDISLAVEDISKGAVSQAEEIESASHDIISMGDMIGGIVDNVSALTHTSESMGTAGEESVKTITGLSESNDRTTAAISQISKQINMTDESVKKIGEAANLITSIASQTSLLSLNASIESARAGEAGKGFAVVATEIQKLAAESSDAAVEIQRIIDEIASESATAVSEMQTAETLIGEQQEKLDETRTKFGEVNDGIKTSREGTEKIRLSADQCNEARTSVVDVISNLSAISQENAASAEETTASMEELNVTINLLAEEAGKLKDTSVKLKENMTFFKL